MKRFLLSSVAAIILAAGVFACGARGTSGAMCAGASELNTISVNLTARGGGGSGPSSSGSHSSGGASSRSGSPAPSNSGARSGSKSNAPSYSGARSAPVAHPTITGGKVPSYSGSSSFGRSYSYRGTTFTYHPASYWNGYPLNPDNPYDPRNATNPFSPFYGEHLMVAC